MVARGKKDGQPSGLLHRWCGLLLPARWRECGFMAQTGGLLWIPHK